MNFVKMYKVCRLRFRKHSCCVYILKASSILTDRLINVNVLKIDENRCKQTEIN